ncbi:MAG: PQQ-dependent sugar dehydrogenase [Pseudomonadota bacterium]|nr:PQQ-dependent sugar dehydrogenase [Pseudomonadota bacterium]
MRRIAPLAAALVLAACQNGTPANAAPTATPAAESVRPSSAEPFQREEFARFDEPWAMSFLPNGRLLVSEKAGKLFLFDPASKSKGEISGVPKVAYGGQGGFGDVVPHPKFGENGWVYFSYAEAGEGKTRGAVVARAQLTLHQAGGGALSAPEIIWRQTPKVEGGGHYAHRIAFAPDGHLFISSGDRQKFDPAQDMQSNMGKIVRLNDDGSLPTDNPFAAQGGVAAQVWTLGHRNPLGIAFDGSGQLWNNEMGPKGGDELNRVVRGDNYGYPIVSDGDHYNGRPIPDHSTAPQYHAPAISWTPVISPSSLIFYSGTMFPDWQGRALIGGLSSQSLVVVKFDGDTASEQTRYAMGARIREVEQGPDGAVWVLEDGKNARLLKLTR